MTSNTTSKEKHIDPPSYLVCRYAPEAKMWVIYQTHYSLRQARKLRDDKAKQVDWARWSVFAEEPL